MYSFKAENLQDMSRNVPGVSNERRLSCAFGERSRSTEQSSADCDRAETSSTVDSPKNIAFPIESKLSLKTGLSKRYSKYSSVKY